LGYFACNIINGVSECALNPGGLHVPNDDQSSIELMDIYVKCEPFNSTNLGTPLTVHIYNDNQCSKPVGLINGQSTFTSNSGTCYNDVTVFDQPAGKYSMVVIGAYNSGSSVVASITVVCALISASLALLWSPVSL